jgi:acyl carrier protein
VISSIGLDTAVSDVVARFARVHPPYAPGAHIYRDLGLESVQILQLLLALEAEFSVTLDDRRFIQSATIVELAHLIGEAR